MRDVIGYEERDPEVMNRLASGYPRFFVHPFLRRLESLLAKKAGLRNRRLWFPSSRGAAVSLLEYLNAPSTDLIEEGELIAVAHPDDPEIWTRAKLFLQHTGCILSSREAEDALVARGLMDQPIPEETWKGSDPGAALRDLLHSSYGTDSPEDIYLARNGMNAFYAAFRAVDAFQRARERTVWIQLGWLYTDTMSILQKFTGERGACRTLYNVFDIDTLCSLLRDEGDRLAGVVTEIPTNPLIQSPDIEEICDLVHKAGGMMLIDPTIASPANIDVLPYSDLMITSLTKYVGSAGDVLMGAVSINRNRPLWKEWGERLAAELEPLCERDVARMAWEGQEFEALMAALNHNTIRVIEFLRRHPAVRKVYWALEEESSSWYERLARHPAAIGSMFTLELNIPLALFYDRVCLPKGPSFGMKNTLLCPFMYLAHYDLVKTQQGRAFLRSHRLDPDLVRVSIGTEPADQLIETFAAALHAK